ncbi:MAG: restriction endonuclease subunit S [Clostridiales bacterium]|nr:restriction endonuclease subunit S [Clostridiales bacterium]
MSKLSELIEKLCPDGVEYKALNEIAEHYTDGMHNLPKGIMDSGEYPILSAQNISGGIIDMNTSKYVLGETFEVENKRTNVRQGDVLLTIVGAIGRVAVVEKDLKALFQRSVCVIKPNLSIIESKFLRYALESSSIQNYIQVNAHGAAQRGLYLNQVGEIKIPVPPLEVQREIVRILDKYTAFETELEENLTAELELRRKQYEFYRDKLLNFGNKSGEVTPEVVWKTINEISENCDNQRKPVTGKNRIAGDYPYYGASGVVDHVNDYIFEGDYLLVSEDGANLLARSTPIAFSISGKNWVNNHAHVLKFETYEERRFAEFYLNSIDLSQWVTGGAQPKLNQQNLNKIPIPVPPLAEQRRIVAILDRFDALCNDLTSGIPAEIAARQKQYEYYRDKLLSFRQK